MPKALQKHMALHLPEGTEVQGADTPAKPKRKKNDGKKNYSGEHIFIAHKIYVLCLFDLDKFPCVSVDFVL